MRKREREITDISEIESVIKASDVCRIAFADGNIPYIVTMNFGYSGRTGRCLYFHCAPEGRKLEMMLRNNYVCFEMDTDHNLIKGEKGCDFTMKYRSVVGYGKISAIEDYKKKIEGLKCILSHYTDDKNLEFKKETVNRTVVLRLVISEMSGKKC